jgi:hypothetical protein
VIVAEGTSIAGAVLWFPQRRQADDDDDDDDDDERFDGSGRHVRWQ